MKKFLLAWQTITARWKTIIPLLLIWGLVSCSPRVEAPQLSDIQTQSEPVVVGKLTEVAPPKVIQELRQALEQYQPQVSILSPKPDQVIQDTTVQIQLQVKDLPIFKNPDLGLGPHLHLFLDNQPYQAVYDVSKPVILENIPPGTHTIRVFASRPWHESFKNEGAYAQTTFHLFTKTEDNNPSAQLPLLTYSRPQGDYGAEPIMLDFYLTNAPLHLVAQANPEDEVPDWRIRATINGQSFLLDNWQPIYLKGFNQGKNWVKLEFLDEQGNPLTNVFNTTVRLINYNPKGKDTLSQLVRGELSATQARGIVEPNYQGEVIPVASPTPIVEETPVEETIPTTEETPASAEEISQEETVMEEVLPEETQEQPTATIEQEIKTEPSPETVSSSTQEKPNLTQTPSLQAEETSITESQKVSEIAPPVEETPVAEAEEIGTETAPSVETTPKPQFSFPKISKPKWAENFLTRF